MLAYVVASMLSVSEMNFKRMAKKRLSSILLPMIMIEQKKMAGPIIEPVESIT